MDVYDVIVVGGGHAGIEAALASARMGSKVLLLSLHLDTVGLMSCNPAIGGVGKAQLVKEIDALGGQMGKSADACGIQFRILNSSRGPAVRSSRCQVDRQRYRLYMKYLLEKEKNITLYQTEVVRLIVKKNYVKGIKTKYKENFYAKTVVLCPGTFLNGLIHIGLDSFSGGRIGEEASQALSENLKELGFSILRFKTGTCARLDGKTIDFKKLQIQPLTERIIPFSFSTKSFKKRQIPCYITYTNKKTHKIILSNLKFSPLYTGKIKATGVRYCPSIEDKVVKFSDKPRHQIFLEPEGKNTYEFYPNGLSTSLPIKIQIKLLHSIRGLEKAEITRPGYGIEHDVVDPLQLSPTLETKRIKNLYLAGQINGTTGYEEAAAQGLIAGINASLRAKGKPPFILDRSEAYIGVLIDDLVTKGTNEPYRMFTSRVEYRLLLREDNADLRLREKGFKLGLVKKQEYASTLKKKDSLSQLLKFLKERRIKPDKKINEILLKKGTSPLKEDISLENLLKRPQLDFEDLQMFIGDEVEEDIKRQAQIQIKYQGFIQRQLKEVERFRHLENIKIPQNLDYEKVPGLSREIKEKLKRFSPLSLGQASRISGVTPAAISLLMVYLKRFQT